jgi:hypothetical protein
VSAGHGAQVHCARCDRHRIRAGARADRRALMSRRSGRVPRRSIGAVPRRTRQTCPSVDAGTSRTSRRCARPSSS